MDTPTDAARPAAADRPQGSDSSPGETASRLSAAIMRILASARGATEGRRTIAPEDLAPRRARSEDDSAEDDGASKVEWSLRMMQ